MAEETRIAQRRTRRLVGCVTILVLAGLVGLAAWSGRGRAGEEALQRGVCALSRAVAASAESSSGPASARRVALREARDAVSEALRITPFDVYAPFLLHVTEVAEAPWPLPPRPNLLELALERTLRGDFSGAQLLLEERPPRLRVDGERHLLRFLRERRACAPR